MNSYQANSIDDVISILEKIITHPGKWIQFLLWIIWLGERGSVSEKINKLKEYK